MNVAFIPVRGGSKSIPLKNIKLINGYPLVYWTIKAAVESKSIDAVYVSTDSEIIKSTVYDFSFKNVFIIERSYETATDTASTELSMLEFAVNYEFDNIVLIQATSPLLTAKDIDGGFALFNTEGTDSVLSGVYQKRFNWSAGLDGIAYPLNYDYNNRPRRQEFGGYYTENGAFYITSKMGLLGSGNRISGKIKLYEMPDETFFEIDEPSDWIIVEQLMKQRFTEPVESSICVKMFLTDCDGCLTDGGMYYSEKGDELKKFNTKDGAGLEILREHGVITGIISGEQTALVRNRADKLKLDEVHLGIKDKLTCVKDLCSKYNIRMENIAYVGDDLNDLEVIRHVGLGCSVANGTKQVIAEADYVSPLCGGSGAVRDVIDYILERNMLSARG
ncbi:acylneuraminate cytidylyltransferase [Enterocloster aldenensis]|uniref:N-acylneuraminate cytidylyltransferase n=1 Tax=Enterocloster aldenensis TaxID=358742 RepID=UPI000E4C32CA|nr:acylneuraminate cytidylyltransferase [Enterocloster aldenensis]